LPRGVYGLPLVTVRDAFADRLSVEVSSRRCACFRRLILVLIGLLVFTPPVSAATFETWTEVLYDAESDELQQAVKATDAAIECAPPLLAAYVPVVAGAATVGDNSTVASASLRGRPGRAPPAS